MAFAAICSLSSVKAQDKVEASLGADLVSRYVWRGMVQLSGASIQPTLGFSYKGLSLSAWGSASIQDFNVKEFDVTLGYKIAGFGISLTDYFFNNVVLEPDDISYGEGTRYGEWKANHLLEGALSYSFKKIPLTLSAATMLAGNMDKVNGDQHFSTYVNASYSFKVGDIALAPAIGASAFDSEYYGTKAFDVMDVSIKATKEIKGFPFYVQAIVSPAKDRTYLVAGMTF